MIENAHNTIENAQERSETLRDGELSGTIILYKITVRKVYKITISVHARSRSKNERITVFINYSLY
jgi:hypothetical protein